MNLKNYSTKRFAIAAAAVALSLSVPQVAQAGSQATTLFKVTDFEYLNVTAGGTRLAIGTDVTLPSGIIEQAIHQVTSNGAGPSIDADDNDITDGIGIDLAPACLGPDCPVANNIFSVNAGAGKYTKGDSDIHGLGVSTPACGGSAADCAGTRTISIIAESVAQATQDYTAGGDYSSNSTFTITPTADLVLGLRFTAEVLQKLEIDAAATGEAKAGYRFTYSLEEVDSAGNFVADVTVNDLDGALLATGLNRTRSRATPGLTASPTIGVASKTFNFTTATTLKKDRFYRVNVEFGASSDLETQVPEPGALAMVALGLLGFAGASFKRKKA